jgi:hypothetical protein
MYVCMYVCVYVCLSVCLSVCDKIWASEPFVGFELNLVYELFS